MSKDKQEYKQNVNMTILSVLAESISSSGFMSRISLLELASSSFLLLGMF